MKSEISTPLKRRRLVITVGVLVVLYAATGFFVLPPIVRTQAIKQLSAQLKRSVTIEKVAINPFMLSVSVRGLSVADHDGSELAGFDEFYANFQLSSLFRRKWFFSEIRLERPRGRVVQARDHKLNISDLIPEPPPESAQPKEPAQLPHFLIGLFKINNGSLQYRDNSSAQPFENDAGPVTVTLRNFGTGTGEAGGVSVNGNTESGERFAFEGSANLDTLTFSGRWTVTGIHAPKYDPLHHQMTLFEVAEGKISMDVQFVVDLHDGFALRVDPADFAVEDLHIRARGETKDVIYIPAIRVSGVRADTAAHTASVERIAIEPFAAENTPSWAWRAANPDATAPGVATIRVTRMTDGTIDLTTLLTPRIEMGSPSATAPAKPMPAWTATIGKVDLVDTTIEVTDLSNERPVHLLIDQLNASATGLSTDPAKEIPFEANLRWQEKGTVAVKGTATREPLHAQADITVADLLLAALDPYAGKSADIRLQSGSARASGTVTLDRAPDAAEPSLAFTGTAGLDDIAVTTPDGKPVASLSSLDLREIKFASPPMKLDIAEVALAAPSATVSVEKDGSISLKSIMKQPAEAAAESAPPAATPAAAATTPRPQITIGKVTITDGSAQLADDSLAQPFKTALSGFGGTISGLSSENLARADVDLQGSLNGRAPLHVTGTINPLSENAFTDLKVDFKGIALPQFTPYSGKFVGYQIKSGRLTLDLQYHLSSRVLNAQNVVVLDNFYLGDTVESPDATHLPVKLALGLLRNRDGKIDLDLPIEGSLDDPDFRYGKVVWKAIGNIIAKAATAPFALLGKLIPGGKDTDLSFVGFAPGGTELSPEASDKVEKLSSALYERPAVMLAIVSEPSPEFDEQPLREKQMTALLVARKVANLAAAGTPAADASAVTIDPAERADLIRAEFAAQFPEEVAAAAATVGAVAEKANEAEKSKPGFVVRTWRRVFGQPEKPAPPPAVEATAPAPGPTLAEMESRLLAKIAISADQLAALASARAANVRDQLLASGQVDASRVSIASAPSEAKEAAAGSGPRVTFEIQ